MAHVILKTTSLTMRSYYVRGVSNVNNSGKEKMPKRNSRVVKEINIEVAKEVALIQCNVRSQLSPYSGTATLTGLSTILISKASPYKFIDSARLSIFFV